MKKFVNDRLDATKQLTGQEVSVKCKEKLFLYFCCFLAEANRGSGHSAPDAEVRCLVWREYVGIHGKYITLNIQQAITDSFQPEFYQVCHTKAQYDEYGPSICRHNPVFGTMT